MQSNNYPKKKAVEKSQKSGTVNFFLHLRVHLRLQVPASSLRLDDLVATVMILRRTVEVTGIRHGFRNQPPRPVNGGFLGRHIRFVKSGGWCV